MISSLQNKIDNRKEFFINFMFAAVAFYFILSAALDIPFYHHDIYKYSTGSLHRACTGNQGHMLIFAFGRPVSAYLDCVNNKIGNTLTSINIMRSLCIGLIAVMVSLFALFLRRVGFMRWPAILMSAIIFLLPITLTTIIMACSSLYVSILFAYLAYYFISKSDADKNEVNARTTFSILLGLFLLIASFFTYPAVTAFYLVPALTLILFKPLSEWQVTKRIVIRDLFTYTAFSVFYFVAAKQLQNSIDVIIPTAYKFNINCHIITKMQYIISSLPKLWNFEAGMTQTVVVYGVIFLGCLSALKFQSSKTIGKPLLQAVASIFILLVFGEAVYLAQPAPDVPSSRVFFDFQVMILLIIFWSILKILELFTRERTKAFLSITIIIFLIAAYFANLTVTRSVLNDYLELNIIITALADKINKHELIKRVHIVGSTQSNFTGFNPHEDIFNVNSSVSGDDATNMVNTALLQIAQRHTFDLTNCTFYAINGKVNPDEINCIRTTPPENIAVTYSLPDNEVYHSPDMLIISMESPLPSNSKIDFRAKQKGALSQR